ncbi:MAG: sugar ABC transporter ATP-binding protein [Phycisphaerales bacterium]
MPLLSVTSLHKRFPGVVALDDVGLDVEAGEVHALMGGNGAGKSTLIRVVTGAIRADSGRMTLDGRVVQPRSPNEAQELGIAVVHQEIGLVPTLSVAENILLGRRGAVPRLLRGLGGIDWRSLRERARAALAPLGPGVDSTALLGTPLEALPLAMQQIVAIARAIDSQSRVLVLDEPTSSLDRAEVDRLFEILRQLRRRGIAIVYVTHFLDELPRIADRVTVLRNGRRVGTWKVDALPQRELVGHMLGRHEADGRTTGSSKARRPAKPSATAPRAGQPALLRVRDLGRRGSIAPFGLELRAGEVRGLAGLLGSGRTETLRLIFGADRADGGSSIAIDGAATVVRSPRQAIRAGLAFCPEDRNRDGLCLSMTARENIALVVQRRMSRIGLLSRRAHGRIAAALALRVGLDVRTLDRPVGTLSGGNRQKVLLARWLAWRPRVLLLDEPTRGIDVGAKREIAAVVAAEARAGVGVVLASSEVGELLDQCDRLTILRDRRHVATIDLNGPEGRSIGEEAVHAAIAGEGARSALAGDDA